MAKAKLFRKKLVPCGKHIAPQGEVVVTPQRVKRWVNKFEQLSKEGVRFPEPWGHILDAIPEEDHEARKYAKSRWNAGYISRLEQDPEDGSLVMLGTVPPGWEVEDGTGDLINTKDSTRIGEVSVGLGNWKDGKGRVHDDIVIHAALVPLPVWANQDSFQALSTQPTPSVTYTSTLSTHTGSLKMARNDDDLDNENPDGIDLDNDGDGLPVEDDLPPLDMLPEPPPPPEPTLPEPPVNMDGDKVRSLVGIFNQMGANLPPDTNPSNFLDRFVTTFMLLQKMGVTLTPKTGGDEGQATTTVDASVGADANPESPSHGGGMLMMSTSGKAVKLDLRSFKVANAAGESQRAKLKADWMELSKGKNDRFKALCKNEADRLSKFTLSLDEETGAVSIPEAIARLKHTKSVIDALGHADLANVLTTSLSTASPDSESRSVQAEEKKKWLEDYVRKTWNDDNAKLRTE